MKQKKEALQDDAPDPHYPYLSKEDYDQLAQYKHFSEKTLAEQWVVKNIFYYFEENILPQWWSANTVTVVGNTPMFIATSICVYFGGVRFHNEEGMEPLPQIPVWAIVLFAFTVQWFDWFDMMDGLRARRLKAGSPIGRIIDEAGDLMIYTNIATIGGYLVRAPPGFLCLCYVIINLRYYFMEINYIITGKLFQTAGRIDIGPFEFELIITNVFLLGAYSGQEVMDHPLSEHVPDSMASHLPPNLKVLHAMAFIFGMMQLVFAFEHLVNCILHDPLRSLYLFTAPAISFLPMLIASYLGLETYKNHFVVFHFMISWTFNVQTYRLFVANMSKHFPFNPFGIEHIFCVIPILVHLLFMNDDVKLRDTLVIQSTYVCTACLFVLFYGHIYLLSMQWLAYQKGKRRWWSIDPPQGTGLQGGADKKKQ